MALLEQESIVGSLEEIERILGWISEELVPDDGTKIKLVPHISSTTMNCFGWFSNRSWSTREGELRAEIAIPPEQLKRSGEELAETLVHEVTHAYNSARGINDCSQNQYHNKKFKATAEILGLDTYKSEKGWHTKLSKDLLKRINAELKPDIRKFNVYKLDKPKGPRAKQAKRALWTCECETKIYCATGKELNVICQDCGAYFERA